MKLVKITADLYSKKLNYIFKNPDKNWKETYEIICKIKGIKPVKQGDLLDFEFYSIIYPINFNDENIEQYYLIDNDEPVTFIKLRNSDDIVDISVTTALKYRKKGYAMTATKMIEEKLLDNINVKAIQIVDNSGGVASHIAKKLGYELDTTFTDGLLYLKNNPNYNNRNSVKKVQI